MFIKKRLTVLVLSIAHAVLATTLFAQTIDPFYAGKYTISSLGQVSGVPTDYAACTFKSDDPQTFLIGGDAEEGTAAIYQIAVVRNTQNIITGFTGTAAKFANAPGASGNNGLDGGLCYGPNNILFYSTYSDNQCGQLKPGSTSPDKLIDLTALGVAKSTGGLGIVPAGFGGAGRIKFLSYSAGKWYDGSLIANATGTFDITGVSEKATFASKYHQGFIYVKSGQPLFTTDSIIVAEYNDDLVATYQVDANGDPIVNTRRVLADMTTQGTGPQGLAFDPVSGDLLISNYSTDDVYMIHGFFPARCPVDTNNNGVGDACEASACGACGAGVTLMAPIALLAISVGRRRWSAPFRARR